MVAAEPLRVGYVLKRYPRFSETFVVHEILAHERAGLPIEIFALGPVEETHFQDCISQVRAPLTRLPESCRHGPPDVGPGRARPRRAARLLACGLPTGARQSPDHVAQCHRAGVVGPRAGPAPPACPLRHAGDDGSRGWLPPSPASATASPRTPRTSTSAMPSRSGWARSCATQAFALTVSDYNLQHLRSRFGTAADRLQRLYNGLDLRRLQFEPPRVGSARDPRGRSPGREEGACGCWSSAARVLALRGVDFECRVIGDGPLRAELQAQVEHAGLTGRLQLLGSRAQPEVMAAMRRAAVLAAPCVIAEDGDRDGLPTVLLEAMALGHALRVDLGGRHSGSW